MATGLERPFFGRWAPVWLWRFAQHRLGAPRLVGLLRGWLQAEVLEAGSLEPCAAGGPQGGSSRVVLSHRSLP